MSHTPPSAREFRRDLRRDATEAEKAIWWVVRDRHLGVKFRRQHTAGRYTLDFYCPELKLAVEIDGGQHYEDAGRLHDEARERVLMSMGVRTLRYTNLEVLDEIDGVAESIWDEVQRLKSLATPSPSPSLSPSELGERGDPGRSR